MWFSLDGNPNTAAGSVWHPQDGIFLNWFARDRENPALAPTDGRYTYMGSPIFAIPIRLRTGAIIHPYAAFGQFAQAC